MRVVTLAISVSVALLCGTADAFYGFAADPADRANWPVSVLYPENVFQFKMRQPDGVVRTFQRDPANPRTLICPAPWVGETRGTQTLVMTDPAFKDGQTGFVFERGILVKTLLDGKEYELPARSTGDLDPKRLWPVITDEMIRDASETYSVHWANRFSLWYKNPNHAAMLLVEVLLLCLGFAAMKRPLWAKGAAILLALACFVGLVQSESRGGMLAFASGIGCFALFRVRSIFSWRRLLAGILVLAVLAAIVYLSGMADHFTAGMFHEKYDQTSRLPIWIKAPEMMVSAPWGWGLGGSGTAYMNWFQPLDRYHCIGTLINSHLTWLVELGWPLRCLYTLAWTGLLFCFAADAWRGRGVLPVALWSAFFVGSIFNSLGHDWTLWVLPLLVLIRWLLTCPWLRLRDYAVPAIAACVVTGGVLAAFFTIGWNAEGDVLVTGDADKVVVNGTEAETWVVDDGYVLDGGCYGVLGKETRRWYRTDPEANAMGIVRDLGHVPSDVCKLVLAGKSCLTFFETQEANRARFRDLKEIVLLSPPFGWKAVPADLLGNYHVEMLIGSLVRDAPENVGELPSWVKVAQGCALYIRGWQRYVTK